MVTTALFVFSAREIGLADTFERTSGVRFELEENVSSGTEGTVWLRASVPNEGSLNEALDADSSVSEFRFLGETEVGDARLVAVDLRPTLEFLFTTLLADGGAVMETVGRDGQWHVTCRYDDHASLTRVSTLLDERDVDYEVLRVSNEPGGEANHVGLTERQHEAVSHAYAEDYFAVPKGATQSELADDLDISHQALSERLRRGLSEYLASDFPVEDDSQRADVELPSQ